ncbi:MAG: acyltransferase family protein [Bacteroidota bacterium]|jgi:peptidoglycan/LPS O-acetylase OafA/YrhL
MSNSTYFPSLTGIRAVAAYMVFIHHYIYLYVDKLNTTVYGILNELHIGVTVFFVLSGFLIANAYLHNTSISFYTYIVRRFARIYPVYILLTITALILKYGMNNIPSEMLITNVTLTKGFFKQLKFSGIAQTWSLTVEETFYLSAPFCFLLIRKNYRYLIVLPAACMLIGVVLVSTVGRFDYYGFMKSFNHLFNYTYFGRSFEFFCGIALSYFIKKYQLPTKNLYLTYIGAGMMCICLTAIYLCKTDKIPFGIHSIQGMLVNNFVLPATGISVLFIGLIREKTWISKILGSGLFTVLGKSSYIFYLLHTGILTEWIMSAAGLSTHYVLYTFIVINSVSILLYYLLEKPVNAILLRIMSADKVK